MYNLLNKENDQNYKNIEFMIKKHLDLKNMVVKKSTMPWTVQFQIPKSNLSLLAIIEASLLL